LLTIGGASGWSNDSLLLLRRAFAYLLLILIGTAWSPTAAYSQRMLRAAEPCAAAIQLDVQRNPSEYPLENQDLGNLEQEGAPLEEGLIPLLGRTGSAAMSKSLSSAVALQIALDQAGFSPGVIDGNVGRKTKLALVAFQARGGRPATGQLDGATRQALGIGAGSPLRQYTLTEADLRQVGPWPKDWVAKSKAARLGYKSLAALAAEKGHCSMALLARLNRGVQLDDVKAGDILWLPNVDAPPKTPKAAWLEIDLTAKVVRACDKAGKVEALFHCSIAKDKEKLPRRSCRVSEIALDPIYLFDPKSWPEVKDVDRKLVIPPGPRNPVGLCWIGLSLPGYGIHGTPEPEMIGKTGSHGCIRLANWDVLRLVKMVRVGMEVRFTQELVPVSPVACDRARGRMRPR
jgi:lipoprotein-anchoring transpeptidase ErfK/SrfK